MSVKVKVGAALSNLLGGKREAEAEGATIGEVIDSLGVRDRICGGDGAVRRHFNIHINESADVRLEGGLDAPVSDGDVVTILSAIAGGSDISRKVWLTFPEKEVERPLIWEVAKKFDVITNIRQASISKKVGIVGLEITGEEGKIWNAIEFFTKNGVTVEPIELDIVE
jgi:molybdopterin converting factor small subunit